MPAIMHTYFVMNHKSHIRHAGPCPESCCDCLQVTVPKRSQSSQDMLVLQQRQGKVAPSLASTPERAADPRSSQQQQEPKGSSDAVSRQPQKAASQGWMSRVKSGILGSAAKKSAPDKKVCPRSRHACLWRRNLVWNAVDDMLQCITL